MPLPPNRLSSGVSSSSSVTSAKVANSEPTAYLIAISGPATNQLKLNERIVSSLTTLRFDDASSRASTIVALRGIQAELGRLGPTVTSMRAPNGLAHVGAAQALAIQQMNIAVGEIAEGLAAQPGARLARLEHARAAALVAEAESRKAMAGATATAIGAAAAIATTAIPVGPVIAAVIASVAAILGLIGTIINKTKEEEAAQKNERAHPSSGSRSHGVRWPP